MKTLLLLAVAGLVLLSGCASRGYIVTLNNGTQITAKTKPQLEGNRYVFENAEGEKGYVPAGRVREIAPASMATKSGTSSFKTTTK